MNSNNKISKPGFLLSVSDMKRAKDFYVNVMEQKVLEEAGDDMVCFESMIALQRGYAGIVEGSSYFAPRPTGAKIEMKSKPNNFQIAFEVEDLEYWVVKIKAVEGIEILHDVAEYHWGQHVFRFYDFDGHIIEIGEDLKIVAKRFWAQGLSVEEIARRFEASVEYVQHLLSAE